MNINTYLVYFCFLHAVFSPDSPRLSVYVGVPTNNGRCGKNRDPFCTTFVVAAVVGLEFAELI